MHSFVYSGTQLGKAAVKLCHKSTVFTVVNMKFIYPISFYQY